MSHRLTGLLSALVVMFALVVGGAAAADVEVANETVGIDDSTSSVYAEINNTASTGANVTVEWVGVDSAGNETGTLDSRDVTVAADGVVLEEYRSDLNATETPQVKVMVTLDNATASAEDVSVKAGTFQQVDGGAGGFLGGSTGGLSNGVLAAGALVVVGLVLRGRD